MVERPRPDLALGAQPYSAALQEFFGRALEWDWAERFPTAMFLRDFETLPERSPFDVDFLAPPDATAALADHLESEARRLGLFFASRHSNNGLNVIVLDLEPAVGGRAWTYLEIHNTVRVPGMEAVAAGEVEIDRRRGFPVPAAPWRLFVGIVQAVRKRKRDFSVQLPAMREGGEPLALAAARLAVPANDLRAMIEGTGEYVYRRLCERIPAMPEKPARRPRRFLRWLLSKFYVLHLGSPLLFTVHGADGVGKTTVTGLVDDVMRGLPLPYAGFHHITGWKKKRRMGDAGASGTSPASEPPASPPRRLFRFVFRRVLNDRWRALWVDLSGYHLYCRRLHARIHGELRRGRLLLLDRYIYDQLTRSLVHGAPWAFLHRTFGRLLMPPRLAIVLVDEPERVRRRKQELTVEEIAHYQETMLGYLSRNRIPHRVVAVAGRRPPEIAREVMELMLTASGRSLFNLLREWKQDRDVPV